MGRKSAKELCPMRVSFQARPLVVTLALLSAFTPGCKKGSSAPAPTSASAKVGIVTDVGGRGDQSFNDSALRGLELWAAHVVWSGSGYRAATPKELSEAVPPELHERGVE